MQNNKPLVKTGRAILATLPILAVAAASMMPEMAHAAVGAGKVAANFTDQFADIAKAIGGAAYVGGALFAVMGITKLYNHAKDPNQNKISSAMIMLVAGGSLLALPSIMETGAEAVVGTGGKKASIGSGLGGN